MLYCDCLTWASLWQVGWVAWRHRLPKHLQIFDFAESSALLVQVLRRLGWHVGPCNFVYGELQDERDTWLYARVMSDLNDLAGQVMAQRVGTATWFQHVERVCGVGKLRLIFIRRIHALLQRPLLQVHLVNCLSRPQPAYLILGTTLANVELKQRAQLLKVHPVFYWQVPPLLQQWVFIAVRRFTPRPKAARQKAVAPSQPPRIYQPPLSPLPGVLLTHDISELTLDHSVRSFPHWLPPTGAAQASHPTYILKRHDLPVTSEAYAELLAAGIQVIAVRPDPQSPHVPTLNEPAVSWQMRWHLYRDLFKGQHIFSYAAHFFWLLWVVVFAEQLLHWHRFLARLNIKVYVTRQPWLHEGLESALHRLGGGTVMYQYSNLSLPHPAMTGAAEVLMVFSNYFTDFHKRALGLPQFFVAGGYLYDQAQALVKDRATQVRQQLQTAGARYIICVFDENWSDDVYSPINGEAHTSFLKFFLEWLLVDPTLGVVMKMQYIQNTPEHFEALQELAAQAQATGRLYVYGEGHYTIRNLPVEAALTADLVVNHIYGATAGLEAALAGVRVVLLDQHHYSLSPLAEWGGAQVVFNSLPAIKHAVQNYRAELPHTQSFGDWSPFLCKFDPFRDGRASERFETLINLLLKALSQNQPLATALQAYQAHWGATTVVPLNP